MTSHAPLLSPTTPHAASHPGMAREECDSSVPAVAVIGVKKHYHEGENLVRAVDGVDLVLSSGDFAVLAGPSGSGKSTLLHLIGGLDHFDEGEIFIDGQSLRGLGEDKVIDLRRRKIGYVFQAYNLLPVLTVFENIQFVLQIQGVPDREHAARIKPLLEELGLADLAHRFPTQLSGGQQQRVAVARSIVGKPTIVLADEPTANLDSASATTLLQMMRRLNTEHGVTFLFSSHDAMVISVAHRVIRLRDGRIQSDCRNQPTVNEG